MISMKHVSKFYGDAKAIEDISFSIGEGEIVGLLGLNGAGKSTILKILSSLLYPSSGDVSIHGKSLKDAPHQVRGLVGFLPDSPPVYPEMTVEDYLLFAAKIRGVDSRPAKEGLEEAMRETGLEEVRQKVIGTLSHGYRQRVGIAQAIVHRPKVLILDEPINGLDPIQIVEMRKLIRGLKGRHTILLSSHILSEISETCDRLLVLKSGELVASGSEKELFSTLKDGLSLTVTIEGDMPSAKNKLLALDGVLRVSTLVSGVAEDGTHTLMIEGERDLRADVAHCLVKEGFALLELAPQSKPLESVFVQLAGQGGQG